MQSRRAMLRSYIVSMPVFRIRQLQKPGYEEANMFEFLISSASIAGLAGCLYVAYAIFRACTMCAQNTGSRSAGGDADPELIFRKPSLDYYI